MITQDSFLDQISWVHAGILYITPFLIKIFDKPKILKAEIKCCNSYKKRITYTRNQIDVNCSIKLMQRRI